MTQRTADKQNLYTNASSLNYGVGIVTAIFASEICFSWIELFGFRLKAFILFALLMSLFMKMSITSKNLKSFLKVPPQFLIITLLSAILILATNISNNQSPQDVLRFFSFMLPAFFIPYYINNYQSLYKLLNILLLVISVSISFQILQIVFGKHLILYTHLPESLIAKIGKDFSIEFRERMPGLSLTGLHQAYLLSCFLPLLTSFISLRFKKTGVQYAILIFLFIGMILTFTRTGLIFGIGTSLMLFLLINKWFKIQYVIIIPIIFVILLNLFINTSGKNYNRFTAGSFNNHLKDRLGLALYGFEIGYNNNFWFGNNHLNKESAIFYKTFVNMKPYNIPFLGKVSPPNIDYPHNIFADTLIKYGCFFLILFIYLLVFLYFIFQKIITDPHLNKKNQTLLKGLLFSFFAFLGNAFFHNIDITSDFNFWLLTGLVFCFYNIVSNSQEST